MVVGRYAGSIVFDIWLAGWLAGWLADWLTDWLTASIGGVGDGGDKIESYLLKDREI